MINYDNTLNYILEEFSSKYPYFNRYTEEDPLVVLFKIISALGVVSSNQIDYYIDSEFSQDLCYDHNLSRLFNIESVQNSPEEYTIYLECDSLYDKPIEFTEGLSLSYKGRLFTTFTANYLLPNNSYIGLDIIEGSYKTLTAKYNSIFDQELTISDTNISINHIKLFVDDEEWILAPAARFRDGKYYSIYTSDNKVYKIEFSNNYKEYVNQSSKIIIKYIKSTYVESDQSSESNLDLITKIYYNDIVINDKFKFYIEKSHKLAVFNKSIDFINKILLTYKKAITIDDYTYMSRYYPEVIMSRAYDISSLERVDNDISIDNPFITKIVVAPVSGYYPSKDLKERLLDYLYSNGLSKNDISLQILDPRYIPLDIEVRVNTNETDEYVLSNIVGNVQNKINELFKLGNVEFASTIDKDHVITEVVNCDSRINYVEILGISISKLGAIELPIVNSVKVLVGYNLVMLREESEVVDNLVRYDLFRLKESSRVNDSLQLNLQLSEYGDIVDTTNKGITEYTFIDSDLNINFDLQTSIDLDSPSILTVESVLHLDYQESDNALTDLVTSESDTTEFLRDKVTWFEDKKWTRMTISLVERGSVNDSIYVDKEG